MKLSAKQQALVLKARKQCLELEQIQESILKKLYFDLDVEETESTSDVMFDALYANWKSDKELLNFLNKSHDRFYPNTYPTGTIITRSHPQLNFGQTVYIVHASSKTVTVNPMGDSDTYEISKELVWPSSQSDDAEGRERALEKNGCYSYIVS